MWSQMVESIYAIPCALNIRLSLMHYHVDASSENKFLAAFTLSACIQLIKHLRP